MTLARELHDQSLVIDAVGALARDPAYLEWYRAGGVTALAPTVGGTDSARVTLNELAIWSRLFRERDDLVLVRVARDIEIAKQENKLGLFLHFQGADPIEDTLDLVDLYKSLGVGVVQLTYNIRNRVGDGCEERTDAGLSRFGLKLVERLNQARVIVDCSHTGLRTSLEAIAHSSAPVILSHSNAAAVHASPRNVADELIRAIGKSGGVIGVVGFPGMVSTARRPSLDEFIAHIDRIVELVGIDHVGLGLDYYSSQAGIASDEDAMRVYEGYIASGIWSRAYPPPPHHYPAGIETPRDLRGLTGALLERGYREPDVRKILGENWLRVMRLVWG